MFSLKNTKKVTCIAMAGFCIAVGAGYSVELSQSLLSFGYALLFVVEATEKEKK